MLLALRLLLGLLGVAAVAIALSILLLGAAATANLAEMQFNVLTGSNAPLTGDWPATMDSELRFYAPFWGAYGLLLLVAVVRLRRDLHRVPLFALLFFVGGIGRAISYATIGAPHPVFVLLMVIELLLPPILLVLWRGARRYQLVITSAQ
jgi:hypothetical protein